MHFSFFTVFEHFSPYSRSFRFCVSFSMFFTISRINPGSYSVYLSFFTFSTVSSHIPSPTGCDSHFASFSVFLAMNQVPTCEFLIFLICHLPSHNPAPTVCNSHFSRFQCFSPDFTSYSVCFSFSMTLSFLAILQVLQCVCLFFHVFHCFLPCSRYYCV